MLFLIAEQRPGVYFFTIHTRKRRGKNNTNDVKFDFRMSHFLVIFRLL